jgi:AraC-like DNA-binding protein
VRTDIDEAAAPPKHQMVDVMVSMFNVDPTLSGKELSARLGLSVSRLARVFKRQMGVSIVEYRNRLRFVRFFQLLAGERGRKPTLRQAARAAGFGSYAHFHRLFRARWRTGPREGFRNGVEGMWAAAEPVAPPPPRVREIVVQGKEHLPPEAVEMWLERGERRMVARLHRAAPSGDDT